MLLDLQIPKIKVILGPHFFQINYLDTGRQCTAVTAISRMKQTTYR